MFGWEFPPRVSGGLGVACEGLVRGLLELDTSVTLVLPFRAASPTRSPGLRVGDGSPRVVGLLEVLPGVSEVGEEARRGGLEDRAAAGRGQYAIA